VTADLVVVGAGVVGLTAALAWARRHPDTRIAVLEKERAAGAHASGRNSGVLHAGFYYSADSLKARFSRDGCAAWKAWCAARDLPVNACGKLVVARSEADLPALDDLLDRGARNGVEVHEVDEAEARAIDPRARTVERALWSPATASIDPEAIMARLAEEARDARIDLRLDTPFLGATREPFGWRVHTGAGDLEAGFVLNAAGLHADRVAQAMGFGASYRILPFKGLYLVGDVPEDWLRVHVYPVPDLAVPFLGVHFTVKVDGRVTIGPTALPALGREQYSGLHGFAPLEAASIALRQAGMAVRDARFRRLAVREAPKVLKGALARRATPLVHDLDPARFRTWGRPGIRAQLLDTRTDALVMDFVLERDEASLHVLNAVSPAFTCALPFAEHLADRIDTTNR